MVKSLLSAELGGIPSGYCINPSKKMCSQPLPRELHFGQASKRKDYRCCSQARSESATGEEEREKEYFAGSLVKVTKALAPGTEMIWRFLLTYHV